MLAIIIPYYKLTFFEATLQSLAIQTDKRFKVYIGDDGSPENPIVLLEKYKNQFDFIYHRFDENLGGVSLVQQWERCIAMIGNEEWFMILGDDDTLSVTCIEEFYFNLSEILYNKCKVIRFATVIKDEVNNKTSSLYTHPKLEKATDFFYRRFKNKTRSSLSEYIFRKSAYEKHGFYNYNFAWYADDRAWLEFSEFNYIYSINSSYMSFRLSDENISRADYKIKEKQEVKVVFFKFVVFRYFFNFKRHQQKELLLYYEQLVYINKKVNFSFWLVLFLFHSGSFHFMQSIKFTRRLLIHLYQNAH
nr:glycosyltransferase family 2 protein [uncultured Flavobacterium sp.]